MNKKFIVFLAFVLLTVPLAYSRGFLSRTGIGTPTTQNVTQNITAQNITASCSSCGGGFLSWMFCTQSKCESQPNCKFVPSFFWLGKCVGQNATQNVTCTDGTPNGNCSAKKPIFCANGRLIYNCTKCGCPTGESCTPNGVCLNASSCIDGTPNGECSAKKPKYCSNGQLIDDCAKCGCRNAMRCLSDGICIDCPLGICTECTLEPSDCATNENCILSEFFGCVEKNRCQKLSESRCRLDGNCMPVSRQINDTVSPVCDENNNCDYDGKYETGESKATCPDYCSTLNETECSKKLMCAAGRNGTSFVKCVSQIENGPLTQIDRYILRIARQIPTGNTPVGTLKNVLSATKQLCKRINTFICPEISDPGINPPTAKELIYQGNCCGHCTYYAEVFSVLARAKGLPIKEVHTVNSDTANYFRQNCARPNNMGGHMFADVLVGPNNWLHVNPTDGIILDTTNCDYYIKDDCNYVVLARGIDDSTILHGRTYAEAYCVVYCGNKPLDWSGSVSLDKNNKCVFG